MAKTLVEGLQVEAAEHVWQKVNEANQKHSPQPVLPRMEAEAPAEPGRVVHVDLVTYLGKRRRRVERLAARPEELDALAPDGATAVQFSLFPAG